jgi:hypothetical protein
MKKLTASLLLSAALFSNSVQAEAPSKFTPKWTVGKTYRTKIKTDTDTVAMGQETKNTMEMEIKAVAKAGATPDTTDVEMTYEKMDVKAKMGAMEMPMGDAMKGILGQTITLTFGSDGQVKDIKGYDKLLGGNPAAAAMFNPDALKQTFASSVLAVPTKDVGPGDSWPFKMEMPNPLMTITVEGKYTYLKDEEVDGHKCAVLNMDATMKMDMASMKKDDPTAASMAAMGMEMKDSTMSGTVYFDLELGNARKSDVVTSMKMSMKNPVDGKMMDIPTTTKVATTLKEE